MLPRQNNFDDNTTIAPEGFVEENGHFIPFWYSRVSDVHSFSRHRNTRWCFVVEQSPVLTRDYPPCTDRRHREVVCLPRHACRPHPLRYRRLLARQAEDKKGHGTARLPQSMFSPIPFFPPSIFPPSSPRAPPPLPASPTLPKRLSHANTPSPPITVAPPPQRARAC